MSDDSTWQDCDEKLELSLGRRSSNRFRFRTINLFGVVGPEHHVKIAYQSHKS
jgi:hypothetical protein